MYRPFLLLLCAALPLRAHADCANDSARIKLALPSESLTTRNDLFSQLCAEAEMYDETDPGLDGRLTRPHLKFPDQLEFDSKHIRGNLLLAFVVELDGSVRHATVLVSSGNALLDQQALATWRTIRYKGAAKIDGRPVRLLMYFRFKAIIDGH
jgi:TonB family protein